LTTPQRIPNYYALGDAVPAWDHVQSFIPATWAAIGAQGSTFLNGWRHYLGGNGVNSPALWRRYGDEVEFAGLIDKNGGNFAGSENLFQLPVEMRIPTSLWIFQNSAHAYGGATLGDVALTYTVATGVLQFVAGHSSDSPANPVSYINLTGLRFPLYTTVP
jgi:hypothetical protein